MCRSRSSFIQIILSGQRETHFIAKLVFVSTHRQWSVELRRRDDGDRVWAGSEQDLDIITLEQLTQGAADNLQSSSLLQPEMWA